MNMDIDWSNFKSVVILTGAGISAESGIATFRDSNGLWEQHRIEDVATPEAYKKDPQLVWRFYSMRRIQAAQAFPNMAHQSLSHFAHKWGSKVNLITQNVDVLHQRADHEALCMHGSLHQSRCTLCSTIYFDDYAYFDLKGNYAPQDTGLCNEGQKASSEYLHHYKLKFQNFLPLSPCCQAPIRPHIVWFGEIPLEMNKIQYILEQAEVFVTIGTSGVVYPAAGFIQIAKTRGAKTICINKEAIPQSQWVDHFVQGTAIETIPKIFKS